MGLGNDHHQGVHPRRVPGLDQGGQGRLPGRLPYVVAVADEDRLLAQQGPGVLHSAAGLQQARALVGDQVFRVRAAPQVSLQLVSEGMHIDHDPLHPGRHQGIDHEVDQRLAGDLDQRLGHGVGERAHARAQTRGHYHGGLGTRPHALASAGTWVSNQALSPASCGSVRLRSR